MLHKSEFGTFHVDIDIDFVGFCQLVRARTQRTEAELETHM